MNSALLLLSLLSPPALHAPAWETAATDFEATDAYVEDAIEKGVVKDLVAMVDVKGERVYTTTQGLAEEDGIFRIFSMTKPITTVAALILVDRGKIDLDTPVAEYLPEFKDATVWEKGKEVEAKRPMTVRDLMRHTSGLTYGFFGTSHVDGLINQAGLYEGDLDQFSKRLAKVPLKHHPGTRFEYSLSSDVLGRVVEVVSEKSLSDFFDEEIFKPLGMKDTGFFVPEDDIERVLPSYGRTREGLVERDDAGMPGPTVDSGLYLGGAGLYGTAADYLAFCQMLLADGAHGDKRLLKKETVDEMFQDQLGELPGDMVLGGGGFGLGLGIKSRGAAKGTHWWGGAAGTGFWIDRERKIAGVFMIQNWMEIAHWNNFQTAVYEDLAK